MVTLKLLSKCRKLTLCLFVVALPLREAEVRVYSAKNRDLTSAKALLRTKKLTGAKALLRTKKLTDAKALLRTTGLEYEI